MSDTHEIEIPVNDIELKKFEVLRQVTGSEDYSELVSKIIEDRFGDIHPAAFAEDGVDLDALLSGEIDHTDVPDEYKIDNYDADESEVSDDD